MFPASLTLARPLAILSKVWSRLRLALSLLCAVSVLSAPLESLIAELHDGDGGATVVRVSEPADQGQKSSGDAPASHDVHICHCAHNHLAGVLLRSPAGTVLGGAPRVPAANETPPPPASREALLRPPILIS